MDEYYVSRRALGDAAERLLALAQELAGNEPALGAIMLFTAVAAMMPDRAKFLAAAEHTHREIHNDLQA